MEKHQVFGQSKYSRSAAMYQPDPGQMKRTVSLVLLLLIVFLIAIATQAQAAEKPANYLVLKGGIYSPGTSHDLDTFNACSTTHLDGFVTTASFGFRF